MYYSPLRYPGGKAKLEPFMEYMMKYLNHVGGIYIEPFAGGAGIAIELLEKDIADTIVINDLDKGIYSFWRAILTETDRFLNDIEKVPLTVSEWEKQHIISMNLDNRYSYELGFATFYMNRTNRSGIIKGGIIGGKEQSGSWKIDARFHRDHLIERIKRISRRKKQIAIYNKDIRSFIYNYLPKYENNALAYFDPPYYKKGKQLYLNFFNHADHVSIENVIDENVRCDWIITYDDTPEIETIYQNKDIYRFDLNYSASKRRMASELMIFKDNQIVPRQQDLELDGVNINFRRTLPM